MRERHLPAFQQLPGVKVAGVVNRSATSGQKIATEFGIPTVYPTVEALLADDKIDAIVIGTWPDTHAQFTVQALHAGKHVLCEARMARTLAEALQMDEAAKAHPKQVAMLVPSPLGLSVDREMQYLMQGGYIGDLREVLVLSCTQQFHDYSAVLHWRQSSQTSGQNVLTLGIIHETVSRWISQPTQVFAQTSIFEPTRPNPHGPGNLPVDVPDSVQVLTQYAGNARGTYMVSGMQLFGAGHQVHLYGSAGTLQLHLGAKERLLAGRFGDSQLTELAIPPERQSGWRCEAEFIAAIRGEEPVTRTTFADGIQYMQFTAAVHQSNTSHQPKPL